MITDHGFGLYFSGKRLSSNIFHLQTKKMSDNIPSMETIKQQIKNYIRKKGITAYVLSKQAGISPSILSLYLNDKRDMTVNSLEKIRIVMDEKERGDNGI